MIEIAGSVSKGMMAKFVGAVFDHDYYFDPSIRHAIDLECQRIVRETSNDLNLFFTESNLGRIEFHDSSQVIVGGIQPNMIVGMLLGAELRPVSHADADITEKCLSHVDLADLPDPESMVAHPLVQQFDAQMRAVAGDEDSNLRPIPPFFWDLSGRAAVHGAMTSGLKFIGDDFLMKMVVAPSECSRLIDWLTDLSIVLVKHFADEGRIPLTGIHVGECASCMVDVDNFRRFVLAATSRLGQSLGPVRFHSCGKSDHLVEAFAQIDRLESLDVGGETSVGAIRDVFGNDFPVGIAPLVDDMSADQADGILAWFDRVRRENGDGNLTIGYHLEADYNLANIRALHRAVEEQCRL